MKIQVTQTDIDNGIPVNSCLCPIALAIARQTTLQNVEVDSYGHRRAFIDVGDSKAFPLPDICVGFMEKFDNEQKVKPFSFELDIPLTSNLSAPV